MSQAPKPVLPSETANRSQHCMVPLEAHSCDLTREIAYNLACLYKASGAVELARNLYKTYLVI